MDQCVKFYSSKQTELIRRAHSENASQSFAQLLIRNVSKYLILNAMPSDKIRKLLG